MDVTNVSDNCELNWKPGCTATCRGRKHGEVQCNYASGASSNVHIYGTLEQLHTIFMFLKFNLYPLLVLLPI